jgi:hypothetical protein
VGILLSSFNSIQSLNLLTILSSVADSHRDCIRIQIGSGFEGAFHLDFKSFYCSQNRKQGILSVRVECLIFNLGSCSLLLELGGGSSERKNNFFFHLKSIFVKKKESDLAQNWPGSVSWPRNSKMPGSGLADPRIRIHITGGDTECYPKKTEKCFGNSFSYITG